MTLAPELAPLVGELDFDPDALRAKYLAERDKRLREDGADQYVEVTAEFSHYVDDPYVDPGFTREPVFDEVEFAIIGGGFGGLLMGARLREAGFESIRVVEAAGDFGGTWYWNRYPGAMCDVESYCYLPLLEELGYMPKHKYSFAPEILEHSRNIARNYRLYDDALLQTSITGMEWDEAAAARWIVSTNRGDRFKARYVAMANGPLSRPKLPGIPGINAFKGHTFHTSRWDYRYTGGDASGGLTGLQDKRVGPRSLDRHRPQRDRRCGQRSVAQTRPAADLIGARRAHGARRLPQDEPSPRARGRGRRGPGDRRGAEAVVPPVLQAPVFPRRVPADLQPAERHPSGHPGPRR